MPEEPEKTGNSPASTGMLTPEAPEGDFQAGKLDIHNGRLLLGRGYQKFEPDSKEAKAALKAIATLTEVFGEDEEETAEFSQAELRRMVASMIGPGEPPKQEQPPQPAQPQQQQQAA